MEWLPQIEKFCRYANLRYERTPEGLAITALGCNGAAVYPVLVSEEGERLQAYTWFPQCVAPVVEDVEELCKELNDTFNPDAELGYHPERHSFWVGRTFRHPYEVGESLEIVTHVCDIAFPLCERIGQLGRWDQGLIELACMTLEDMSHA